MVTTKAKTTKKASERQELTLRPRSASGKRPARRLRGEGFIPSVLYGKGIDAVVVSVARRELVKALHSKMGEHALVTLRLEGSPAWEQAALVKAVQHDPVSGHVVHVDFHAIALTERLKVKVPLVLTGEATGVKQEGGVLEHFLREIEVECLPADIPAHVEFDVSALTIGDTVHVRDVTPPANAKITSDPDSVIASLQKPKEVKPEAEAEATVTEPEVLREKKPEEGEAPESKGAAAPDAKKEKEAKS